MVLAVLPGFNNYLGNAQIKNAAKLYFVRLYEEGAFINTALVVLFLLEISSCIFIMEES